ncbi:hypothetical protein Srubr_79680 [Streptomyces rubradiris]|uniref:Uncharacterized protein n=1 Tax=Streptomyces rubradiris TaxID=285531 RepID=A0ABQ3RQI7_STRRR|nr:hypothetical protein GCM10018792_44740 [Streptomyces rubradiris]GHI58122.1 hypothetical protein Srubr_79680 [Streptomyces rubradiris]
MAGNGIRAVGGIDALEREPDFPLPTANQVLFRHAPHLAGAHEAAARLPSPCRSPGARRRGERLPT